MEDRLSFLHTAALGIARCVWDGKIAEAWRWLSLMGEVTPDGPVSVAIICALIAATRLPPSSNYRTEAKCLTEDQDPVLLERAEVTAAFLAAVLNDDSQGAGALWRTRSAQQQRELGTDLFTVACALWGHEVKLDLD